MLISIRNVKFINMRKLTTFITAVCVLFYFLCFQIDHHHNEVSLSLIAGLLANLYTFFYPFVLKSTTSPPYKNNQNAPLVLQILYYRSQSTARFSGSRQNYN